MFPTILTDDPIFLGLAIIEDTITEKLRTRKVDLSRDMWEWVILNFSARLLFSLESRSLM